MKVFGALFLLLSVGCVAYLMGGHTKNAAQRAREAGL